MKKLILVFALVLVCIFAFTACNDKIEEEPKPYPATTITISTADDLANIKNYLGSMYVNYTFSLENDLDISVFTQWDPIGTLENPFMATFLGNGKTISNLTYIGMDNEGKPTVAAPKNNIALFGFTQNAKITNLQLTDINLNLYTYGDYFHTAGLVAYNIGKSEFSDITIDGRIDLSNIYFYNTTYGMDGKVQDGRVITCNTTQYTGGLIAYSSGNTSISNINVSLDINNKHYKAVYEVEEKEVDGEMVIINEGYSVNSYSNQPSSLPRQTIAGLLAGSIKNGATIDAITVSGDMEIYSKSVYGAPAVAILIGSEASNITSNNCNLTLKGSEKVGGAGAISQLDSSKASIIKVNSLNIHAEPIGGSVKNISVGGIVSYCYDRAILLDSEIVDFIANTTVKDKLQLGGIAGVVRDATVTNNKTNGVFLIDHSNKIEEESYLGAGSVVYAAYGNAVVKDNQAAISITLRDGATRTEKLHVIYRVSNNTPYVNEDGKSVSRFAALNNLQDYVEVTVNKDKVNEITTIYHDSEGRELGTVIFNIDENLFTKDGENWYKYMSAYYSEEIGLINANGEALVFSGKSFASYKQITGIPEISNNTIL